MGDRRSFRIESKRFDLVRENDGTKQFRISEKGSYHWSIVYMGREGVQWLGRCMDENILREGERAFTRTLREHGKTFIIRRYNNKFGRYIEVLECGMGGSRERIVIPEGQQRNGWKGFTKELKILVNPETKSNNQQAQWGAGGGGGVEVGKNLRRNDGTLKTYREAVSVGNRETGKIEKLQKSEAKLTEAGTVKAQVTAVPAREGRGVVKAGAHVTPENPAQIKPRQPLRFFPNAEPVIARNLGTGLTIHINASGQRQVAWTAKGMSDKLGKQWVPRDKQADKSFNQEMDPIVGAGISGPGPRSTYEVGESSGSNKQQHGMEKGLTKNLGLESTNNRTGSTVVVGGQRKIDDPPYGLSRNFLKENNALITGQGAYQIKVDGHFVEEIIPTNRGRVSEFPVKLRIAGEFLSLGLVRHIDRENILIEMGRFVRGAEKLNLTQVAEVGDYAREAEELQHPVTSQATLAMVPSLNMNLEREPREDFEVLDISPLRTCYGEITQGEHVVQEQSEWVQQHMTEFSKLMGVAIEGFESEALRLFEAIERRWRQNGGTGDVGQETTQKTRKGLRELRNLACSINYESSLKLGGGRRLRGANLAQ